MSSIRSHFLAQKRVLPRNYLLPVFLVCHLQSGGSRVCTCVMNSVHLQLVHIFVSVVAMWLLALAAIAHGARGTLDTYGERSVLEFVNGAVQWKNITDSCRRSLGKVSLTNRQTHSLAL